MKWLSKFKLGLVVMASVGVMFPQLALASAPGDEHRRLASDIALQADGSFKGQIVDQQGAGQVNQPVMLLQNGQPIATTFTNDDGQFGFRVFKGGVYQVQTAGVTESYRMWSNQTAPPSAVTNATLVKHDTLVRGQNCAHCGVSGCAGGCVGHPGGGGRGVLGFLANPWVLGGLVAAAIAIPLALDDDDAS